MFRGRFLPGLVCLAIACGDVPAETDAGSGPADGAPAAGDAPPSNPMTHDVEGQWSFRVGEPSDELVRCEVLITPGQFDAQCPADAGRTVAQNCIVESGHLRARGSLGVDGLAGALEEIWVYQGQGCASAGYTTGIPVVRTIAAMSATHDEPAPTGGFWSAIGGAWTWRATDPMAPSQRLECAVRFALVGWEVECPLGAAYEPALPPGCAASTWAVLRGTIGPLGLAGKLQVVTRFDGGCAGLPAERIEDQLALDATR